MKRAEVDKVLYEKITEMTKSAGQSRREIVRQILVAGIRAFSGNEDFMRPYPNKQS